MTFSKFKEFCRHHPRKGSGSCRTAGAHWCHFYGYVKENSPFIKEGFKPRQKCKKANCPAFSV